MWFFESVTHKVVMMNNVTKGNNGRTASMNGRIFPVRFLYDLQKAISFHIQFKCNYINLDTLTI